MSLLNELDIVDCVTSVPRPFVRTQAVGDKSLYVNLLTVSSPTILVDTIEFRASSKGSALSPNTQRKTYNVKREFTVVGTDTKVYTASVNFTVNFPGGNSIPIESLTQMVFDVVAIATNVGELSGVDGGIVTGVSPEYMAQAQLLMV